MRNIILVSLLIISASTFAQKANAKKKVKKHNTQASISKTEKGKLLSEFTSNLVAYTAVSEEHPLGEASTESETLLSEYGIKFSCVKFTPSNEKCVFNYTDKYVELQSAEIGIGDYFPTMYSPSKKIMVEVKYLSSIINKEYPLQSKVRVKFSVYEIK